MALLSIGCGNHSNNSGTRPSISINGQSVSPDASANPPAVSIDQVINSDPCAVRLHDISGAMLEYYALHNRLPARLEELQSLADLDRPLNFVCPTSVKPYAYAPGGLSTQGDSRLLVLYDAAPTSSGQRWAILMQRPKGRQPAAMWVVSLTEPIFRAYTPITPTTRP